MRLPSQLASSAAILIASAALGGCGSASSAHTSTQPVATHPSTPALPQPARTKPHPANPPVGAAQAVHAGGATLSVTVVRVLDPLRGAGAALLTGTHAVGVLIRIRNNGPGVYDSSATGDVSIAPSTGTTTPVFASHGVCQTPLRDFDNYITAGELRDGCVVFAIENDAKLLSVRFSPHGQPAGRVAWRASP